MNTKTTHGDQDWAKISEKLTSSLTDAKGLAGEFQKVQDQIKSFMTPIEQKNIKFDGISCVLQLFSDRIAIVLPGKDEPLKYYKELDGLYEEYEKSELDNLRLIDDKQRLKEQVRELTLQVAELQKPWWTKFIKRTK